MTDLDALRVLYAKATHGHEWTALNGASPIAEFAVALHNAFPSLAAELESLRAVYAACVVKYPNGAWACELCEGSADGHAEGCAVAAHERLMAGVPE